MKSLYGWFWLPVCLRNRLQLLQRAWPGRSLTRFIFLRFWPALLVAVSIVPSAFPQDAGSRETEMFGRGVAITVVVHDPTGEPIASAAVVKVLRGGTQPAGIAQTSRGQAEIVVNDLGEFTVVVEAAGYPRVEKELSVNANGRLQVDVYLTLGPKGNGSTVGGRAVLAPKAKKALDQASESLSAEKLSEAEKHLSEAARLAPRHPDVLYLQGVLLLKQKQWERAEQILTKATQLDPAYAAAFAALGMALFDQGKYDAAVGALEKSLQMNGSAWETRWALGKAYYQQGRYEEALQMCHAALETSNGKAPEMRLLVAQALTAAGKYEDAAQALRDFLREYPDRREAATARRWLERLSSDGKIASK